MSNKMQHYLDRFRKMRVLVIGESILDVYVRGTTSRLCREAPVPIVDVKDREEVAGGAANTAANIMTLGGKAHFLSVTGCDREGETLMRILAGHGVDTEFVVTRQDRSTLAKYRILVDTQLVVRVDTGSTNPIDSETEQEMIRRLEVLFPICDAVIVSDYKYGIITPGIIQALGELQRRIPKVLVVDSKSLEAYTGIGITAVKPNYGEAIALLNLEKQEDAPARIEQMRVHGRKILDITGAKIVAVTIDTEGAWIFERDRKPYRTYTHPSPHNQAAGAGDTFTSMLTLALAAHAPVATAGDFASAAAAITVRKHGTTPCYHSELVEYFSDGNKHITDLEKLRDLVQQYKQRGLRVVFTNGCFDILHSGHVTYLKQAKALGDILIIGMNTDDSIRRLKGQERPINSLEDRIEVLAALGSVDHVVAFDEDTPVELIKVVQPDIFVKGGDYTRARLPEAEVIEQLGGRVEILPYVESHSTTSIIERIRHNLETKDNIMLGAKHDKR